MLVLLLVGVILITASIVGQVYSGVGAFSETQSELIIEVSEFPVTVRTAVMEVKAGLNGEPLPLLMERKSIERPYWVRKFPAPEDAGYLLFSGVVASEKQAVVQLIKISDGAVLAQWTPDWGGIMQRTTAKKFAQGGSPYNQKAINPILLAGGDIIFSHSGGSLVRMSPCNIKPVWLLNEVAHHSNELDETDSAVWVPSVSQDGFSENPWLHEHVRDDALAHISIDGRMLEKRSFARILRENGLQALLMGVSGEGVNEDPIHLNEIKAARKDSKYWKRGDLLISSRHLSTIFIYRPSNNKIIWYQTGPWKNQHSVDFVDDHSISVFDNNVIGGPIVFKERLFLNAEDTNRVMVYDFNTTQVTEPFSGFLAVARPRSWTQGRARILHDGGLFLEETNQGRHLRFMKDRLMWSRVNDYDDKRIGAVAWSRYLTAEEARMPLKAMAERTCLSSKKTNE